MCDRALKSCSVNVFNDRNICNICRFKAKKGFKELNIMNVLKQLNIYGEPEEYGYTLH